MLKRLFAFLFGKFTWTAPPWLARSDRWTRSHWLMSFLLVILLAFVTASGLWGWRWYQSTQAEKSSVLYQAVSQAARANDAAQAKEPATQLVEHLTRSASAAGEDADDEARDEAIALLEAVAPGTSVPRRLPVIPH